jgi:hypothetical protein
MATFAYGRVSTKDQTSDNQRLEIERAGFKVDYWFADEGVSGKTHASLRPQFKALLSQIRDGEILVVSKLDRLGRTAATPSAAAPAATKSRTKGLSFAENRELERLPAEIEAAERAVSKLCAQLAAPETYAAGGGVVSELNRALEAARAREAALLSRWELLEAMREEAR